MEPTPQELADLLDIPVNEVIAVMSVGFKHVSMDTPLLDGKGATIMYLTVNTNTARTDEKIEYFKSLHIEIERSLKTLTDR